MKYLRFLKPEELGSVDVACYIVGRPCVLDDNGFEDDEKNYLIEEEMP